MRNLILGLSLSVAFIVGCLARPLIVPPVRAGTNPQKWEYKCFTENDPEDAEKKANLVGRHGWEMAATMSYRTVWCFKRRLP